MKEASAALEEKTQHQAAAHARLEEENQRLEERANSQNRQRHRDQDAQEELQAALRKMTASSGELAKQLAEAEKSNRELQKGSSELQARLAVVREEKVALGQQLQLEREVHQKEVLTLKAAMEDGRAKKEREVQETLTLCRQERDEIHAHLSEAKVSADFPRISDRVDVSESPPLFVSNAVMKWCTLPQNIPPSEFEIAVEFLRCIFHCASVRCFGPVRPRCKSLQNLQEKKDLLRTVPVKSLDTLSHAILSLTCYSAD